MKNQLRHLKTIAKAKTSKPINYLYPDLQPSSDQQYNKELILNNAKFLMLI